MKAAQFSRFGGPEVLEIVELPEPHPGPGQVRIAVRAAGVNASDWKKRRGLMDQELPQTLGHEAAGVVDALGDGVSGRLRRRPRRRALRRGRGPGRVRGARPLRTRAALARLRGGGPAHRPETAARPRPARRRSRPHAAGQRRLSGTIGSAAVQLAVARGSAGDRHGRTGQPGPPALLGPNPSPTARAWPAGSACWLPDGVDLALDVAGSGCCPSSSGSRAPRERPHGRRCRRSSGARRPVQLAATPAAPCTSSTRSAHWSRPGASPFLPCGRSCSPTSPRRTARARKGVRAACFVLVVG